MVSPPNTAPAPARRLVLASWVMLPVFVVWTLLFIFFSRPLVGLIFGFEAGGPGDTFYVEAWGPWIAITLVWLAPVVAGVVLAALAVRSGARKVAWGALIVHGLLFAALTVPNIVERLVVL
jgi:hypothetical protein